VTSAAGPATERQDATAAATYAAKVFGVEWRSSLPLVGFEADGSEAGGAAQVLEAPRRELRTGWADAETVFCRRFADGRPAFAVERTADAYRVRAPRHGVHVVAGDGHTIRCARHSGGDWSWQRLLYAQALPLAVQLQGLHVLHASAVCVGDSAVAFLAPSGTGKSTLAANLVARGHGFLTDDVLAVAGSSLTAHAGPQLFGVGVDAYDRLSEEGRSALGRPIGQLDKIYLATPIHRESAPLRRLYFLERGDAAELEIHEQVPPQPASLLGGFFLPYLQTAQRLVANLELCDALATRTRVFTVRVPSTPSPEDVASAIEAHILEATAA
jgi:hypothetical protein